MKKIALIAAIVCSTTLAVSAQTPDSIAAETPQILFNSTELDYGVIERNSNGTRLFEFTNTGEQPLLLTNVSASCGCTVVEWAKDPIKPGGKGSIVVKYNTNIVGPFHKSIRVFSNARNKLVSLTIKGDVKPLPENSSQNQQ